MKEGHSIENDYPAVLKDYGGEVVIIGISYDAKKKEHSCVIERFWFAAHKKLTKHGRNDIIPMLIFL